MGLMLRKCFHCGKSMFVSDQGLEKTKYYCSRPRCKKRVLESH